MTKHDLTEIVPAGYFTPAEILRMNTAYEDCLAKMTTPEYPSTYPFGHIQTVADVVCEPITGDKYKFKLGWALNASNPLRCARAAYEQCQRWIWKTLQEVHMQTPYVLGERVQVNIHPIEALDPHWDPAVPSVVTTLVAVCSLDIRRLR